MTIYLIVRSRLAKEPPECRPKRKPFAITQAGAKTKPPAERRSLRDGLGTIEAAAENRRSSQRRLEKEAKANATASKVIAEAKKARDALMGQMKTLRDEGSRLAKELKRALGDADKREAARRQAVEKIAELRKDLAHRTEELKRKSEELAQLAMDSAGRARDIIMSEVETASPSESSMSEPPTVETESVTAETLAQEETPEESSIEEEVHPERKN